MQIEPSKLVSHITAPTGAGGDHPARHGRSADALILQTDRKGETLSQSIIHEDVTAVQKARNALRAGTLETNAAFNAAAEALLTLGI
jgi:hypothetical protein